eukprot:scaffold38668_cov90-Phaeocystis_antarctica.AAC.2
MHSQSSVRDDYKSFNLGSRNGAVCNVSYATATQRLEKMGLQSEAWLHELRTIVTQMDIIFDSIQSVQVDAVRALQDAMLAICSSCRGRRHGEEGACVRADRADTSCRARKRLTSQRSRRLRDGPRRACRPRQRSPCRHRA